MEANDKIEVLRADIQKYTADAALLSKEIAGLDEDLNGHAVPAQDSWAPCYCAQQAYREKCGVAT